MIRPKLSGLRVGDRDSIDVGKLDLLKVVRAGRGVWPIPEWITRLAFRQDCGILVAE